MVFHAGTERDSGTLKTAGGRVLAVTSTATKLSEAVEAVYDGVKAISYTNMHYRKDIGRRVLDGGTPISQSDDEALTYASSGVSIDAGNSLVQLIKALVKSTARPGVDATIGGFGGVIDLFAAGYSAPPKLVGGTDGVGTKLYIAHEMNKHDTIGIDCIAMNRLVFLSL